MRTGLESRGRRQKRYLASIVHILSPLLFAVMEIEMLPINTLMEPAPATTRRNFAPQPPAGGEPAKILIVDDDRIVCNVMTGVLERQGHRVQTSATLAAGIEAVRLHDFDIVFLDVQLPDGNGLEQLPDIQTGASEPEVIIITGHADPEGVEASIRCNAWDYIQKPIRVESIQLAVSRALQYRKEKEGGSSPQPLDRKGIVGESAAIRSCLDMVARAAAGRANILITGETGTGKELFARAIHRNSPRCRNNFVVVDCGCLPDTLIESLLFGHTRGAFTGADQSEEGFIKHADGGTLFLDEIGELPPATQKAFLRVLQERRFIPVGGSREVSSDFRLVAATNRNLEQMAQEGEFRDDLLFRLKSVTVELPPLRERIEDLKDLSIQHIRFLCDNQGIGLKGFSPEFFEVLSAYSWPGNVRELYGALEHALAQAFFEQTIFPKHLPESIRIAVAKSSFRRAAHKETAADSEYDFFDAGPLPSWRDFRRKWIIEGEKRYLENLAAKSRGNVKEAARYSGLSSPRLYELLRKHRLSLTG